MSTTQLDAPEQPNSTRLERLSYLETEQGRKNKILRTFCLIFLALEIVSMMAAAINLLLGITSGITNTFVVVLFLMATICSYWLARNNHYAAASRLLIGGCTLTLVIIYYLSGSDIPLMIFFLLPIILAIILLDTRATIALTSFCVLATLILFVIQDFLKIYTPITGVTIPKLGIVTTDLFITVGLIPALVALILIPTRQQAQILRRQNTELFRALQEVESRQQTGQVVSEQVRTLAAELKDSAAVQAGGSQEQAAVVSQVNVSLNELSLTASNIAEMAVRASNALDRVALDSQGIEATTSLSVQQSEKGLAAVKHTLSVSREVAGLYQEFLEMTNALGQRSINIRQILDILDSIAAETHLLSLNAAIEAAGAGEHGERFGVVAQEVKSLAARSSQASRQVGTLIEQVEEASHSAAELANNGYRKAQEMEQVVEQTGQVIDSMSQVCEQAYTQAGSISQASREVKELTGIIRVATNQQHVASEQVLDSLAGLRSVAEENAAGSQVVSSTATNLEEMSRSLSLALTN